MVGMGDHVHYLGLYGFVLFVEFFGLIKAEIAAFDRELNPNLRLRGLGLGIA
jgi:hypothetical protein